MKKSHLLGAVCAWFFLLSATVEATLIGRLPTTPGDTDYRAFYDDDLGVTWIADANLAASDTFGVNGIGVDGSMDWDTANSWITAMNASNGGGYLGYDDWRLPTTTQPDAACSDQFDPGGGFDVQGSGSGCLASEMGHLANSEGVYWDDPPAPTNPFSGLQYLEYWSGSEYVLDPDFAWRYGFDLGGQGINDKSDSYLFAWAVRSGDVSAVPVPASVWLFGSGLLGLVGVARRKKAF